MSSCYEGFSNDVSCEFYSEISILTAINVKSKKKKQFSVNRRLIIPKKSENVVLLIVY
jgi:hypothetical protein